MRITNPQGRKQRSYKILFTKSNKDVAQRQIPPQINTAKLAAPNSLCNTTPNVHKRLAQLCVNQKLLFVIVKVDATYTK